MKSSVKRQDLRGYHNANLEQSTSRLIQGGTWKKQRVIRLLPTESDRVEKVDTNNGTIYVTVQGLPMKVYLSHVSLIMPPNQPSHQIVVQGDEVGTAYSNAIEEILRHPELSKWEYILTLEHDNCPPPDGLVRLLERMERHPEYACIGGLYWTKGHGGIPQIWGDPNDASLNYRPRPPDPRGGLVECCGTGMGFNLWRLAMFKDSRLRRPFFKTVASMREGVGTQDLYFWGDARKYGYRCAVDCSVQVGHYDALNKIMW